MSRSAKCREVVGAAYLDADTTMMRVLWIAVEKPDHECDGDPGIFPTPRNALNDEGGARPCC